MIKWIKNLFCSHFFPRGSIKRTGLGGNARVVGVCVKCGQKFYADCGLNLDGNIDF